MKLKILQKIISSLESGALVVTASHRQNRFVRNLWDQHQLSAESTQHREDKIVRSWSDCNSLSFDEWLNQLFEYSSLGGLFSQQKHVPEILDKQQQQWLFRKIIRDQQAEFSDWSKVQQETLLNNIQQAWIAYSEWLLDIQDKTTSSCFFDTEETRLFRNVIIAFEAACKKNNWISQANLLNYLTSKLPSLMPFIGNKISFYGFVEFTPQQQRFINKLELQYKKDPDSSIQIIEFTLQSFNSNSDELKTNTPESKLVEEKIYPCASVETEWVAAAKWSRQLLEKNNNNSINIAIIIPDLTNKQQMVFRIFQREFQPETQLSALRHIPKGFNFSAGENFHDIPLIQIMKHWLGIFSSGNIEHWGAVLSDSFCVGYSNEKWARAQLKHLVLSQKNEYLSIEKFLELVLSCNIIPLNQWLEITHQLAKVARTKPKTLLPSKWANWFMDFLKSIPWPLEKTQDSITFQIFKQWQQLIRSLSKMDAICGNITLTSFSSLLDEQLSQQRFQPETPKSSVHVLGSLEAIGISFDFIRITGCQADSFPGVAKPNPFLPLTLQRKLDMPNATSQRELRFVKMLLNGYRNLCGSLTYSYAVADGETLLLPSPLLMQADTCSFVEDSLPEAWMEVQQQVASNLIQWQDDCGLPLKNQQVRSGISILKDQAACPFRAYVRHRLHVTSQDKEDIGVSSIQRGNWVHNSLEMVWRRLGNHKTLREKTTEQLIKLVQQCVDEIILNRSGKLHQQPSPIIQYEIIRTNWLVLSWLEIDKSRSEFIAVELEKETEAEIGGLTFKVRADRVDTLVDENKIIIDYKTGKCKPASWNDDRIDEPQLPLYALIEERISAIAFAQLNREACKLTGYGDEAITDKGIENLENWAEQLELWKKNLELLAMEFISGLASVTPKKGACDYCDLLHVCRFNARIEKERDDGSENTDENIIQIASDHSSCEGALR